MHAVTLALLALLALAGAGGAASPHVYLVVIDGLDARLVTRERMPTLVGLGTREPARTSVFTRARAVMPTRTNPNHVTLLTGAYADTHGITGNAWWSRATDARASKSDVPALIEVETVFTVIEKEHPERVTLGVFGKPKLARLFGAAAGRQRAPDVLWSPDALPRERADPASGYSADADTMAAALAAMATAEPDLAVLNLAGVDSAAHAEGPDSARCREALGHADAALGRLVDDLRARGRWARSVLIVTADHGFAAVAPTPERPAPAIALGQVLEHAGVAGVRFVADGGVGYVYAERLPRGARLLPKATAAVLARAAAIAAATPGVAEVLARLPVAGVPTLVAVHADWRLAHERIGELLVVAAPGYQLIDPSDPYAATLRGNHGGPGEQAVPLVVTGGWPGLAAAPVGSAADAADVGATIAHLLELRPPRGAGGAPMPAASLGHPLYAAMRHEYGPGRTR